MAKFRKKPVVIEAVQLTKENLADVAFELRTYVNFERGILYVKTLEGTMEAGIGDWIITGVKGERYPCKADVFALTYEPVEGA